MNIGIPETESKGVGDSRRPEGGPSAITSIVGAVLIDDAGKFIVPGLIDAAKLASGVPSGCPLGRATTSLSSPVIGTPDVRNLQKIDRVIEDGRWSAAPPYPK